MLKYIAGAILALLSVTAHATEAKVLVLGQSNAANWLQNQFVPTTSSYTKVHLIHYNKDNPSQWYDDFSDTEIRNPNAARPNGMASYFSCPSDEANCDGGSTWSRVGTKLVDDYGYTSVKFYLGALPGTSIDDWLMNSSASVPSRYYGSQSVNVPQHLTRMLNKAVADGVTHVVWVQGESDAWNNTSASYYSWALRTIAYQVKQATGKKLIVNHSTICHNNYTDANVQAVINGRNNAVSTRPDLLTLYESTDGLTGSYYRRDAGSGNGCHLSDNGAAYTAGSWATAIVNN